MKKRKTIKKSFKEEYISGSLEDKIKILERTIRFRCIDCCGNSKKEALLCKAKGCPNYNFRFLLEGNINP